MFSPFKSDYSLRTKATLIVVAVVAVSLSLATAINIFQTNKLIEKEQEKSAESIVRGLAQAAELPMIVQDTQELDRLLDGFLWNNQIQFLLIYNRDGKVVAKRVIDDEIFTNFAESSVARGSLVVEHAIVFQTDKDFLPLTSTTSGAGNNNSVVGKVLVALSLKAVHRAQMYQAFVSLVAAHIAAAFGIFLIVKFIGDWTHRVDGLVEATEALKGGDFSHRVPLGSSDEIGKLASAFEAMREAVRQRDAELHTLNDSLHDLVRERTEKLENAMLEAQTANEAKSSFLANMSHEIRTPMNAIIGMVGLALNKKLSPKLREYLLTVRSSAESLLTIINDILDFSKIEAGKIQLERVDFQLNQLFEKLADMFSDQATFRDVELVMGIEPGIPVNLHGDPLRLEQVFINLLGNAVKFTEEGMIFVHATLDSETETGVRILFSVSDTGVGIKEDQYESLFEPFTQLDGSMTREYGGTGLGLSICRRLVNLHGGEIWVNSTVGIGTTIFFTAEFERQRQGREEQYLVPSTLKGLKVLLIDDNKTARCITSKILESFLFQVDLAASCYEAMELFKVADEKYDLILIDWKMPEIDGIECTRRFKDLTAENEIPVIMMTAFGGDREVILAKEAGVDYFLTKPVKQSLLFDTIMDVLNHPEAMLSSPRERESSGVLIGSVHLSGVRVLLAEDNRINQNVARELLESVGIIVEIANNGQEAVHILQDRGDEFDAVLMDVQMPMMDGLEATRIIRQNPALADIVIIAVTAHAMQGDRDRCLRIGMNDYVAKPITPELMFSVLTRWTRPGHVEQLYGSDGDAFLNREDIEVPESLPGLHIKSGVARMAGNLDAYVLMLKDMLVYGYEACENISKLIGNDIGSAIKEIHTLKGTAANLSAHELQKISLKFEIAMRDIVEHESGESREIQARGLLEQYEILIANCLSKLKSSIKELEDVGGGIMETHDADDSSSHENVMQILKQLRIMVTSYDPTAEDFWVEKKSAFRNYALEEEMARLENHLRNYNFERAEGFIRRIEQEIENRGVKV